MIIEVRERAARRWCAQSVREEYDVGTAVLVTTRSFLLEPSTPYTRCHA